MTNKDHYKEPNPLANYASTSGLHATTGGELEEVGAANPPKTMDVSDRKDYEKCMETRLSEIGAKIDEFTDKAEAMKEQAACKLQELKEKQQEASVKLQSLKETSAEAWTEFKHGMDNCFEELSKAWDEMKAGCASAASKFEK